MSSILRSLAAERPAAAVEIAQRLPTFYVPGEAVEVVGAGEGNTIGEIALCGVKLVQFARSGARHQVIIGHAGATVVEASSQFEALHDAGAAAQIVNEHQCGAERHQRAGLRGGVVDVLGQQDGPVAPVDGGVVVAIEHAQVRLGRIGAGKGAARRERLRDRDGALAGRVSVSVAQRAHQRHRVRRETEAAWLRIAISIKCDRLLASGDRRGQIVEFEAVRRKLVQQGGVLSVSELISVCQRDLAVCRRLSARAAQGSFACCEGCPAKHGISVAGPMGMVSARSERRRRFRQRDKRGQHARMQLRGPRRQDGGLDRRASKLVAKTQGSALGDEQTARQSVRDSIARFAEQRCSQRRLDLAWHDRQQMQHLYGRRGQPGGAPEHRVPHARGHDATLAALTQ